jgi:hypothetical protein
MSDPSIQDILAAAQAAGDYHPLPPDPPWWVSLFTFQHLFGVAAALCIALFLFGLLRPDRWYRNPVDWMLDFRDWLWGHIRWWLIFITLSAPALALLVLFGDIPAVVYGIMIAAWGLIVSARRRARLRQLERI